MPFLQEFGPDDIFRNNLETSPRRKISAYSGSVYIEDSVYKGQNISTGSISLYEINVDRTDISGTNTARAAWNFRQELSEVQIELCLVQSY